VTLDPRQRTITSGVKQVGDADPIKAFEPVIRALLKPEAYPHPVADLHLLETHLSWVILTGPYAYKIKKPVAFGFVDFSTETLRAQACREELRLNRRLSPQRYVDLVAVVGPGDGPGDGAGAGAELTKAVRMVQFDQSQLLPAVLERDELSEPLIAAFAEHLARFHRDAAQAPMDSPWGLPAAVIQPVQDNLTALASCTAEAARLGRLGQWVEEQSQRLTPWIGQRRQGGFIRECHGDLHLGNMLLGADGIEVFDALEFSPTLRWIDPISELAFLVMDLAVHGQLELGNQLLNHWVEASGDAEGLRGWAWYSVYRALVRAKVTWLRLGQGGLSPEARQQGHRDLEHYLNLAESWCQPRPKGLVLMHGLSGSGKSTVAARLSAATGALVFRSDVERKRLFGFWGTKPTRRLEGELYGPEASAYLYGTALPQLVEPALAAGLPVVLDACFLRHSERQQMARLAARLGVPIQIVACRAPEPVLRQRLLARTAAGIDPSDATVEVMEHQRTWIEPLSKDEEAICHWVDALSEKALAHAVVARFRP
jgi:uncharacterized protein